MSTQTYCSGYVEDVSTARTEATNEAAAGNSTTGRGTCSTEGCGRVVRCRGLCQRCYSAHWETNKRHVCTVDGCETRTNRRDYCPKHLARVRKYGDPHRVDAGHGRPKPASVLRRVERVRGRARDHACVECGNPAARWWFDPSDPVGEVITVEEPDPVRPGLTRSVSYSLAVEDYRPLCSAWVCSVNVASRAAS